MGRSIKLQDNVLVRADGRRLKRVYAYLSEDTEKRLKSYCFREGEDVSVFIDRVVARELKRIQRRKTKKAPKVAEAVAATP